MSKESLRHISKDVIFRETFNSAADVIANGGTITDVTFDNGVGTQLQASSNGATLIYSGDSVEYSSWNYLSVIRTSSGLLTFYIYNKNNKGISGIASQNSGTPTAGTTNTAIGNKIDGTRGFDGKISDVKILSRAWTAEEVAREFSSNKSKFGL